MKRKHRRVTPDLSHTVHIAELIKYYESGGYLNDISNVVTLVKKWLIDQPKPKPMEVVIFDIDETVIQTDWSIIRPDTPKPEESLWKWMDYGIGTRIEPIFRLYEYVVERGYVVFFITGRDIGKKAATEKNLKNEGFSSWQGITYNPRTPDGKYLIFPKSEIFKTAARWSLVERGYDIVLNIGDQESDFAGGYSGKCFKLPNPFYTTI